MSYRPVECDFKRFSTRKFEKRPERLTSEQTRSQSDVSPNSRALPFFGVLLVRFLIGVFVATAYMWRSNVLRLRKCCFTTTNYGVCKWYSSARSLPVTAKEFEAALAKIVNWKQWPDSKQAMGEWLRTSEPGEV